VFISLLYQPVWHNTCRATLPRTRFSLLLVPNMTCCKRQKFVTLINLRNRQLWKNRPGEPELRETLLLWMRNQVKSVHTSLFSSCSWKCVRCSANQGLPCLPHGFSEPWGPGQSPKHRLPVSPGIPCRMAWPPAAKPTALSAAPHSSGT